MRNAWTLSNSNNGDCFVTGSYSTFTLTGADNDAGANTTAYTELFTTAATVNFAWTYATFDCCGAYWDPAGYVLNGVQTQLSDDAGGVGEGFSGSASVAVAAGDTFGWYVFSRDSIDGVGTITVSAVPEPETWALMLSGLAWLGAAARRSRRG